MADITEVKLPDASTFNIKDASALHPSDNVNSLNSTATDVPLAANMGHTLGEEINAIVNVYGAKNIVKNELYKYGASVTSHDVIFTQLQDDTISMSGTATAGIGIAITPNGFYAPVSGGYKLSGGDSTDLSLVITDHNGVAVATAYGTETTVTLNAGEKYTLWISVANGTVTTGRYFYPMLRDARIVDPTYEPYAETNQQLTVNKANRSDLASLNLTGTKNTTGATITAGTYFYLNGHYCITIQDVGNNADFTENTNYVVTNLGAGWEVESRAMLTPATGISFYGINDPDKAHVIKFKNGVKMISGLFHVDDPSLITSNLLLTIPAGYNERTGGVWCPFIPNDATKAPFVGLVYNTNITHWFPMPEIAGYVISPIVYI